MPDLPPLGAYGCVQTDGPVVSPIIRRVTTSYYNHTIVHVGGGRIVEATPRGIVTADLAEYAGCRQVWNDQEPLTDLQRRLIAHEALGLVGRRYGWLDCLVSGLSEGLHVHPAWLSRLAIASGTYDCSMVAARAYAAAGINLAAGTLDPGPVVSPAGLADRVARRDWRHTTPAA